MTALDVLHALMRDAVADPIEFDRALSAPAGVDPVMVDAARDAWRAGLNGW